MATHYPKLNQFLDYRTFLIAHAQEQKRKNPQWSYGAWAKRLGLGGTATITRIIHGDRHPGPKLVDKLVGYFGFSAREAEYFRDLVQLDKLKTDPKTNTLMLEKLGKKYSTESRRSVDEKTFQTISNWYFLTIREMLRLHHFRLDANWIANMLRFKVNLRQISHAIQILQDLNLITVDSNGKVVQREGRLETSNDIASEAIKRYHEEMLENAKNSLRNASADEREVSSQTLALNSKNMGRAKELIREFQERFAEVLEEDQGDQVYQFQIQLFPLTHRSAAGEPSPTPGATTH